MISAVVKAPVAELRVRVEMAALSQKDERA